MSIAKIFSHGRSQAIRLPKEFRFPGTEVHVRRVGNDVVLSARPASSPEGLMQALDAFEPGLKIEREQPAQQERAAIKVRR